MSEADVSRLRCGVFAAFSPVYHSLVDYSGGNQKLMGKSMCVSDAVKDTLLSGVMCESDSPGVSILKHTRSSPQDRTTQTTCGCSEL